MGIILGNEITIFSGSLHDHAGSSESSSYFTGSLTTQTVGTFQPDPADPLSIIISGSGTTKLYFSGSGRIGVGTTNPERDFDIRSDDFAIRKKSVASGIRMNEDGNFESFNNDTNAAATGSEIILKYTRGTKASGTDEDTIDEEFYEKERAQADDVLGSIRWVADSSSLDERVGGEAGNIKMKVASSDAEGVTGKLSINIAADPGAESQQLYLINGATQKHEFSGSGFNFGGNITAGGFIGNVTGKATSADTLETARTIGGVSFNGSANINLPGVNTSGNQATTGNATTATKATRVAISTGEDSDEESYATFAVADGYLNITVGESLFRIRAS